MNILKKKTARRKRSKRTAGFSLIEMLAVTLVLSILMVAISSGISYSMHLYQASVFRSESNLLSSEIDSALSGILHFASYVSTDASNVVHFSSSKHGITSGSFAVSDSGTLILKSDDGAVTVDVINSGMFSSARLDFFGLSYSDGVFSGSYMLLPRYAQDTDAKYVPFCFSTLK